MLTERAICQVGTPKSTLVSITIGDVNGIIDPQNTKALSGDLYANIAMKNPIISGIVSGSTSCWLSASFSTAEPMAANIDA